MEVQIQIKEVSGKWESTPAFNLPFKNMTIEYKIGAKTMLNLSQYEQN